MNTHNLSETESPDALASMPFREKFCIFEEQNLLCRSTLPPHHPVPEWDALKTILRYLPKGDKSCNSAF